MCFSQFLDESDAIRFNLFLSCYLFNKIFVLNKIYFANYLKIYNFK